MSYLQLIGIFGFAAIFLFLNFKILLSDIQKKIIPNKILLQILILVPFFYTYSFFFGTESYNVWAYILQAFITIFAWFCLYLLWLWWAGDVKYLVVLGIFLHKYWFLAFASNIWLVTVVYLWIYFLWFYLWKCLFTKWYAVSLYTEISRDLKDKFETYIKYKDGWTHWYLTVRILLNWCIIFLCIFVGFRLIRLSVTQDFAGTWVLAGFLSDFFMKYPLHMSIASFFLFWTIRYLFIILMRISQKFLWKYFKIQHDKTSLLIPIILLVSLICFIFFEYFKSPIETINHLHKIFTFYVLIFIAVKVLYYAYKVTFQIAETYYIDIKELSGWEIADRLYLANIFWKQWCLWAHGNTWMLSPNPQEYFLKLENPLSKETVGYLKKIFRTVNSYHKKQKTAWFQKIEKIKLLKTFSLWPYIFLWFLITFFFGDTPAKIFLLKIWEFMHFLYKN